jgi:hypothetical protein
MNNLPAWIPNLNAWMSSFILIVLARGLTYAFQLLYLFLDLILPLPIRGKLAPYSIALLSPIILIAFIHHWLHLLLDRFFPNTKSPEMGKVEGFLPGLMSWWEGFFGWQALAIAMLASSGILVFLVPPANTLDGSWNWWWFVIKQFLTIATLIQLIVIAYLYQLERIVRNHLMSFGSERQ